MKTGYKTTEFWAAVAPIVGMLTVKDGANQNTIIICASVLAGSYMLSRTALKWKSTK
jgi:hypothetical protein